MKRLSFAFIAFVTLAGLYLPAQTKSPNPASIESAADRARLAFIQSRKEFLSNTNDLEAGWHIARACFDLADVAENDATRADWAEQGISMCRKLIARQPKLTAAHYYLGMNLGQLARTKTLGALRIVDEMERVFKTVRELDAHFDYAGADRNLGLLYHQTPSIGSIGSRSKARQHLRQAVDIAPESPENRLNFIEACLKWGDRTTARRELQALEVLWPEARSKFTGDEWARSWKDWKDRLQAVQKKIEGASKILESPRHSSESK